MAQNTQDGGGDVAGAKGVDLAQYSVAARAEDGSWMQPNDPVGAPLDCRILVHGEDSRAYAQAMNRIADMRADRQRQRRRVDTTYDDVQMAELILARFLTVDWEGIEEKGVPLECSDENKRRIYSQHRWLAEQVVAFARDRGNFFDG